MEHREIEVKIQIDSPRRAAARLRSLGAILHRKRHFEDNFVFDYRDGRIRKSGSLLRVRISGVRQGTLTFKGPRRILGGAKSRLELESELTDGPALIQVLHRIGMRCAFRYQKQRTVFLRGSLLIMVDETPIGSYLEIEGKPDRIESFAARLGCGRKDFITRTYYELFQSYRRENLIRRRDMMFGIETSK